LKPILSSYQSGWVQNSSVLIMYRAYYVRQCL